MKGLTRMTLNNLKSDIWDMKIACFECNLYVINDQLVAVVFQLGGPCLQPSAGLVLPSCHIRAIFHVPPSSQAINQTSCQMKLDQQKPMQISPIIFKLLSVAMHYSYQKNQMQYHKCRISWVNIRKKNNQLENSIIF